MKGLRKILKANLLLKITSLNALVISIRLIISLVVQRLLALTIGETGIAKIGQIRNLIQILTSSSSLGTFHGVVKYVAEYKDKNAYLKNVFTTTFVFVLIGALISSMILFFAASWITYQLFGDLEFLVVIKILALLPIFIGVNRVFQGVINGLSEYKKNAKIELISYMLSVLLLLIGLYNFQLEGVLIAIIVTPVIQLLVVIYFFGSILKKYIKLKDLKLKVPYAKEMLAFTLMSFVSTILLNYIELDIRTMITKKINIDEAGYWTAMNFLSRNYMVFSSSIFTLYIVPKFARIYEGSAFKNEVINIYKTLLPLFGIGMLLVYIFRETIIEIVYPNFSGMEPLFKWQLLGDFIRLATLVVSHQFLAKKMVKSFILTELMSLGLFFILSKYLVTIYGVEGVVMAHFYRYIVYFWVVAAIVRNYFINMKKAN
ncbi:O-antigen translocase [Seonamhaeicola maritimus]|uniref:O-antigen translocase n=1 Tax=Seonamhaeicola maritimus TaxID=2591822 RepID=UPI0024958558|nr:O-antigen translocase [Seonamhaeicola maritimus]